MLIDADSRAVGEAERLSDGVRVDEVFWVDAPYHGASMRLLTHDYKRVYT